MPVPSQPHLVQKLVCLSAELAAMPSAKALRKPNTCEASFFVMPAVLKPEEAQTLARAAHEVWALHDEISRNPSLNQLIQYRLQSIPASAGERRSLLHAPELGVVRLFDVSASGELFLCQTRLPLGASEQALEAAWEQMRIFSKRIEEVADSPVPLVTQPLSKIPSREGVAKLIVTTTRSAKLDESRLRWLFVALFTVTVVGVFPLQALAMAGWPVPMADIYAVFFMLVGSAYLWARQNNLNDRQLTYRVIAQTLEIYLVWQRAAIREPVTAQFQLRRDSSLKWVRELLRFTSFATSNSAPFTSSRAVLDVWLPTAILANDNLAKWHARRAQRMKSAIRLCYGFSGLLTALVVLGPSLHGWMDLAVGATLGIASSIGTLFLIFGGTLGYNANADLHQHLVQLLQRTQQALASDLPDHEYDELLIDVGRECIQSAVERAFQ